MRSTLIAFPLGLYALSRLLQLAFLWWMAPDDKIRDRLLAWDGGHFVRVAQEGYPTGYSFDADGNLTGNGLAFFPAYPMLVRLVHYVTRLDYGTAAITVSWLAGGAAAVLLCALFTRLYDERVGLVLTALFCVQPMSMVLSMGYSEALFTALVAGMLLCAHRGDWLPAGLLGLGAGLTRPTGAAAAIALAVAAGIAVYRARAGPRGRPRALRSRPRALRSRPRAPRGRGSPCWRPPLRSRACPPTCCGSGCASATWARGSTSRPRAGAPRSTTAPRACCSCATPSRAATAGSRSASRGC
ncbi:glycosyltransferase family protein [Dactylosporangium darangshiense]|uniref:hypothetical protein n=1 Tax=Dactylosporangium darangshiense TaxID=579108 RepID=UPI00362D1C1B